MQCIAVYVCMFVEIFVTTSALFTLLAGWYNSAVSLPPSDIILAELASPLNGTPRFKNVNNCLNTKIYSYLEKSGGQSSNPYLIKCCSFFKTRVD